MIAANSLAFFADIVPGVILEHKEVYATEKTFKFSFHNRKVAILNLKPYLFLMLSK